MCLRALLFVFTSLLLVLSLGLIAVGLWITIDEASMVRVVSELLNATNTQNGLTDLPRLKSILDEATSLNFLNVVLIAVGGVVFFVALSGFCGTRKDSPRLLITFAFFTLAFLALQIALVIHTNNNNGDIFADVWESFNASETKARVVNNTEQESSSQFLMPLLSVFLQSGVCSLIPGVLLFASLSLACTADRRKVRRYIDTTQDES
jgi:hypothetical protein